MLKVIRKIKNKKVLKLVPAISGLTLFGMIASTSSAYANTAQVDLNVNVAEGGITVTVDKNTANIDLIPTANEGLVDSGSDTVNVRVVSQGGHKLVMYGDTELTSSNTSSKINSIASTCTAASGCDISTSAFGNNKWGYTIGSSENTFRAFSGFDTINVSPDNGASDTAVTFGAKIDIDQPAGAYTNTFYFAAVGNVTNLIMQEMKSTDCTTTAQTVYDWRDNTSYTVQQLPDGKCWMLDNLALDPTEPTVKANMNEFNTNASATSIAALLNGSDNTAVVNNGLATAPITANTGANGTSGPWKTSIVNWEKDKWVNHRDSGKSSYDATEYSDNWTVPRIATYWKDDTITTTYKSQISAEDITEYTETVSGKVGVYYNYCAASAGSYCYNGPQNFLAYDNVNPDNTVTMTGSPEDINATEDICPAKWRLPTGGNGGEFQALYSATNNTNHGNTGYPVGGTDITNGISFRRTLGTPLTGRYHNGDMQNQTVYFRAWSSTRRSAINMNHLYMDNTTVYLDSGDDRHVGYSIRCVLNTQN